jgi:hypothetical protein
MTLAHQKYLSGIAEYVLFMWQMEDLARAVHFDIDALDSFIKTFAPDDKSFQDERKWFMELFRNMRSERIESRGHLADVEEIMVELSYLHQSLLRVVKNENYVQLYETARPHLDAYEIRSKNRSNNEVELCLQALYGLLVLRLKREVISAETEEAMSTFSTLLAGLSKEYFEMKKGGQMASLN